MGMGEKIMFTIVVIGLATMLPSAAWSAAEIGSGSIFRKTHDLHETTTRLAERCMSEQAGVPINCVHHFDALLSETRRKKRSKPGSRAHAARWPDDPNRKLDGVLSAINFGARLSNRCRAALRRGLAIDKAGLMCSSHFGRLQFFHAQSWQEDGGREETLAKMLAWARLSFRVATDPEFGAGESYCETIERLDAEMAGLARMLTLEDKSLCKQSGKRKPWTIRTLYSLRCLNFLSVDKCRDLTVRPTSKTGENIAAVTAAGALLHMVQDSYSQSHAFRKAPSDRTQEPNGPFQAVVLCQPIASFYSFSDQTSRRHGPADKPPSLDSSCLRPDRQIDDVITASARIIWHIDNSQPENRDLVLSTYG